MKTKTTLHLPGSKNVWRALLFMLFALPGMAEAQTASTANYTFATGNTGSFTDMSSGTTQVMGSSVDNGTPVLASIGFDFWFMGTRYTQFSAGANGIIRLGGTALSGSTYTIGAASQALIAPFGGDLETSNSGKVHYILTGTAPNRVLTVEFLNMGLDYTGGYTGADGTFQVKLFETTGAIEFVYGPMFRNTSATSSGSFNVGISSTNSANNVASVNTSTNTVSYTTPVTTNSYPTGATITDLNSPVDGSRKTYIFTPPVPAQPSAISFTSVTTSGMTLNWTDNATNELGYVIYRSNDGGSTYNFVTQLPANSTTYTVTGLFGSTSYSWKVSPVTEGALNPVTGTETTTACAGLTGTFAIPGTYPSITAAIADLTANGISGPLTLELTSSYVGAGETYPIVITSTGCFNPTSSNQLTIRPEAGATGLTITSGAAATMELNGTSFVSIDGRPGGLGTVNELTIANTSTSGVALRFINDASNNSVIYTDLRGVNTSATGGVVQFSTTTGSTGNDNNVLAFCNIGDGATTPTSLIVSAGSTGSSGVFNSGNTITNCNLFNFWNASAECNAFKISNGSSNWVIVNNSVYQTATRSTSATSAYQMYAFNMNNSTGSGHIISSNFIGGTAPNAGGTPLTVNGGNIRFTGMYLNFDAAGAVSTVTGNTFANFAWTTSNASSTMPGIWSGPWVVGGPMIVSGNTIGDMNNNGSVMVTASANGGVVFGIGSTATNGGLTQQINGNNIGGIITNGTAAGNGVGITAIHASGSAGSTVTYQINGNNIGSGTQPNSLLAQNAATTSQTIKGIENTSTARVYIVQNVVRNLSNNAAATGTTGAQTIGITATSGIDSIAGNVVHNLSNAANQTSSGSTTSVIGISQTSTTAPSYVYANTVRSLENTGATGAIRMTGIHVSGPTSGTNLVSRNFVHSLDAATNNNTTVISGITVAGGNGNIENNMVRLGINAAGTAITDDYSFIGINETGGTNNYYHNSVYIGATGVAAAAPTYAFYSSTSSTGSREIRNNIFVNSRSNSFGPGLNYSIRIPATTGLTVNNNVYLTDGMGGTMGAVGATNHTTLADWQTATGFDGSSASADPHFVNPTGDENSVNLHISTTSPTPVESAGVLISSVTEDFDGDSRAANTPTDIGADAGNFVPQDLIAPAITYTPVPSSYSSGDQVFTATITDQTGIPLTGANVPRVYFKKFYAGTYVSAPGTFVSGTAQNSVWTFTISATALGGIAPDDSVYYFVVAQDLASPANLGSNPPGALGADVNTLTAYPALPNSFKVFNALTGTITVGVGQTYPTLTGDFGLFQKINNEGLSGDVNVVVVTDITEPGTHGLNTWTEFGTGSYNLRITPDGAVPRLLSGAVSAGMIRFNGVDRVTIDGNFAGSGRNLVFRNASTTGPVFTFINDAKHDSLLNIIVEGQNTSTGNILFSTTNVAGGTGNDSNVVMGSQVRDLSSVAGVPTTLINSTGTATAGLENSGNIIYNNQLFNFSANAVNLSAGSDTWTLSDNQVFQTASRTTQLHVIRISTGSNHVIANNSLGGSAADRSGAVFTTTTTSTPCLVPIYVTSSGTNINVTGNTISNMHANSAASDHSFIGISFVGASGTISNNTIGGGAAPYDTIRSNGDTKVIRQEGSASVLTITSNTIGNVTNATTDIDYLVGISSEAGVSTIQNNIVRNIRHVAGGSTSVPYGLSGITVSNSTTGNIVEGNTVYDIFTNSTSSSLPINGIYVSSGAGTIVRRNRIYDVYATNTATTGTSSALISGILVASGGVTIQNNQISVGNLVGGQNRVYGVRDQSAGVNNYFYNSVHLTGTTAAGTNNSYAFLRTTGTSTPLLRNNILYNGRTTAGTGFNYAAGFSSATGVTPGMSNYNLLIVPDLTRVAELPSGTGLSATALNALYTGPYNSNWMETTTVVPATTLFVDPAVANLNINTANAESWYANGKGIALPGISGDFDAASGVRSTAVTTGATDIGSDEFTTGTTPPAATASAAPAANTTTTYTFGGRTIAMVNWDGNGTAPSALDVRYYTGVDAPGTSSVQRFNSYYDFDATGGSGYGYTISLSYDTSMLGTVTSSATARLAENSQGWQTLMSSTANPVTGMIASNTVLNGFNLSTGVDMTTPLSIQLLSFTGINQGERNRLDWSTSSEDLGDQFILQRSTDGKTFTDLANIMASGKPSTYSYWDEQPAIGVNYYRLKLVSANSSFRYSQTVALTVGTRNNWNVTLSPNPASDFVNITMTGTMAKAATWQISDMSGRTMATGSLNSSSQQFDISSFAAGIYILRIGAGNDAQTIKFTKQ